MVIGMSHPDFAVLTVSWELALRADGYADNTVKAAGWPSTILRSVRPT
jgi:hypothetical protein